MDVGATGVEALLKAQPLSRIEEFNQFLLHDNISNPPFEEALTSLNVRFCHHRLIDSTPLSHK
jgi:hypothetical protein